MSRLTLLTKSEQHKFDSTPNFTKTQQQKYFSLNGEIEDHLIYIRKPINKVGFLIQLAYFRASGKFFPNQEFKVGSRDEQLLIVACKSFIQNCIILSNYLFLSQELEHSKNRLLALIKQNSVISWKHINLHGEYDFTVANDENYRLRFDVEKICKLKVS